MNVLKEQYPNPLEKWAKEMPAIHRNKGTNKSQTYNVGLERIQLKNYSNMSFTTI